jgi:hypothetical protein
MQEQIAHLEKAAQSFAQAEALDPGKNDAAKKENAATEKLEKARNELDKALSKAEKGKSEMADKGKQPGEPAPGEPAPGPPAPGQPGQPGGPPKPGQGPPDPSGSPDFAMGEAQQKQALSFSKIRMGSEKQGQFVDKSKNQFIRDW